MENQEIKQLKEALSFSPDNILIRKMYADALLKYKRWEEAAAEYKICLSKEPNNHELFLKLVEANYLSGKISEAIVLIENLLEMSPSNADYLLWYARLLFEDGSIEEAKEKYEEAIGLDKHIADHDFEKKIENALNDFEIDEALKIKVGPEDVEDLLANIDFEKPKIKFSDVGGMEAMKEEIRMKIIHPLEHPEIYKAYGKKVGGGILFYGPPGCGKTYLARATAGEVNANFISVGISDVLDMYYGQSEQKLHELFEKARSLKPCVLFFDEVDALGASRSDMKQSVGKQLINQFLSELDGMSDSNEGVLILAATNAPWHLDPAFRRPGRFDRIIFVPPPDEEAREAIFEIHLENKPHEISNLKQIAQKTKDFSGADIKAVIDIAIEDKLTESIKAGKAIPITSKDIASGIKKHRATTVEWFSTAKNYALFANEGGIYDHILSYLKIKK